MVSLLLYAACCGCLVFMVLMFHRDRRTMEENTCAQHPERGSAAQRTRLGPSSCHVPVPRASEGMLLRSMPLPPQLLFGPRPCFQPACFTGEESVSLGYLLSSPSMLHARRPVLRMWPETVSTSCQLDLLSLVILHSSYSTCEILRYRRVADGTLVTLRVWICDKLSCLI